MTVAALKRSSRIIFKIKNIGDSHLAAAGFAIDRLEGDGIKKDSWFTTPLGEALAGTACDEGAGVGYLT